MSRNRRHPQLDPFSNNRRANLNQLGRAVSRLQWQQGTPFVHAGDVAVLVVIALGGASHLDVVEESKEKCR